MSNSPRNILIVEDDVSLREVLSLIFAEAGDEVRSTADGLAALSEIMRTSPDVLISDLNMPDMSGFELLPIVRYTVTPVTILPETYPRRHLSSHLALSL
jgi:DNA-binding response OmpR family regulator